MFLLKVAYNREKWLYGWFVKETAGLLAGWIKENVKAGGRQMYG